LFFGEILASFYKHTLKLSHSIISSYIVSELQLRTPITLRWTLAAMVSALCRSWSCSLRRPCRRFYHWPKTMTCIKSCTKRKNSLVRGAHVAASCTTFLSFSVFFSLPVL